MIEIYKKYDNGWFRISVQENMQKAEYFCEVNRFKKDEIRLVEGK